ncbi:MAG: spore germination protein [Acidobacteriota bacterium]
MRKITFKKTSNRNNDIGATQDDAPKSALSSSLESNIKTMQEILSDDDTLIIRFIENQANNDIKGCLLFFDGMVSNEIINEYVIQPMVGNTEMLSNSSTIDIIKNQVLFINNVEKTSDINRLIDAVYDGDAIFLLEGSSEALVLSSKGWQTRAIEEPEAERALRGPREGFTESLLTNLTMIRRKLKTPDLKLKMRVLGKKSHTNICVCYIKGIVNEKILNELYTRLDNIEIDGVLDSGYIQEIIRDSPYTLFKTLGSTERPDVVASKLLEGRIAVIVDGSPTALTVPHIFIEYFQSNDDYYLNFYFSSIGRMLRILGFISTISIPPIYVAITTFHQEIIPTPLLISISAARSAVPFPTIFEVLLMLFVFELLRETGLRMPMSMGQAVSIVGALVMGTAAVDARLVSAPMVIVTAFTGITGLIIPRLKGAVIVLRLVFLLLASFLGLYGYVFGISGLLIHLFELRTFGVPYMYRLMFINPAEDIKDTAIRAPWWHLKYRQRLFASNIRKNKTYWEDKA